MRTDAPSFYCIFIEQIRRIERNEWRDDEENRNVKELGRHYRWNKVGVKHKNIVTGEGISVGICDYYCVIALMRVLNSSPHTS